MILKKTIKKLKSKDGSSLIYGITLVLSMLIIIAGISEYFRLKILTSHIKDILQATVIDVGIENYENIYSSNREGYVSGNLFINDKWKEVLDEGDIYNHMSKLLDLRKEGDFYIKYSGSEVEYKLSGLQVSIKSPRLRSNEGDRFIVESIINLEIPHSFGWSKIPALKLKLKVDSEYMLLF